ncbi:hypothetical protein KCP69_01540 [Salmonella enterica subsp. enterica]|nr:hypothetical protein KCP69_01540 [Salmonella enterica subsp. enterica]
MRVESLVPAHCEEGSIDSPFGAATRWNEQMVQQSEAARELGWCCVTWRVSTPMAARVGVEAVRVRNIRWRRCCRGDNVFGRLLKSRWYRAITRW